MCLQWCHVHRFVIDNDLPCCGCDRSDVARLPAFWSCAQCVNQVVPDAAPPRCGLTRETLPLAGRCCHWQAEPTRQITLHLADDDLAPWLAGSAAQVFADSPSAPPIRFESGRVRVALNDLSVPLVYGVPADEWDAALGWDRPAPLASDDAGDTGVPRALIAALDALDQNAPALAAALADLADALGPDGAAALPDGWADIWTQLVLLSRARAGSDAAVTTQLDAMEDMLCTLP